MKTFYSFIVAVLAFGFASCSSATDDDVTEQTSHFESVMNTYGVEYASYNVSNIGKIPSVYTEDMCGVLEALRQNSNTRQNCIRISEDSFEKVVMTGSYKAVTRNGALNDGFALNVELKFSFDKNQVYYWGTDYSYSSDLFDWSAQGLSLTPMKDSDGYTYEFESETYLYFKVSDEADTVVKVPVIFKGNYNFHTEKGTYSFQLLKYSK